MDAVFDYIAEHYRRAAVIGSAEWPAYARVEREPSEEGEQPGDQRDRLAGRNQPGAGSGAAP